MRLRSIIAINYQKRDIILLEHVLLKIKINFKNEFERLQMLNLIYNTYNNFLLY